jgi:hypothetical protein
VVVVTRDSLNRTCVDWFEDENCYYNGDRLGSVVAADQLHIGLRYVRPETAEQMAATFLALVDDPRVDVSSIATHRISEPGAPLEPLPRSAA